VIIRTPSSLTAYLQTLATLLPGVRHVVTGEGSRSEAAALSMAHYPQMLIETPEVSIPRSEGPKTLMTRIFSLDLPGAKNDATHDLAGDRAYLNAEDMIAVIRSHSDDSDYGFSLMVDRMEIVPVIAHGSDQRRGWMFELEIEVDQDLCHDRTFDPADFSIPQFSWLNSEEDPTGANLTFTNLSIYGPDFTGATWYWQEEIDQEEADVFDGDSDPIVIEPIVDGPPHRVVHVWLSIELRIGSNGITLWTYARIDTRLASGISVPFIPHHPI